LGLLLLLLLLSLLLAAGCGRVATDSVGATGAIASGGIVGGIWAVDRSRGFASGSLVGFVTAWLLWCDGIRSRHGAYGAEAQSSDCKLCEHAAPERFEPSALRWRQVFRQREERELVQGGAEPFQLSIDVTRPRGKRPALRGVGPEQTERRAQ
jgi:hypothetical protein